MDICTLRSSLGVENELTYCSLLAWLSWKLVEKSVEEWRCRLPGAECSGDYESEVQHQRREFSSEDPHQWKLSWWRLVPADGDQRHRCQHPLLPANLPFIIIKPSSGPAAAPEAENRKHNKDKYERIWRYMESILQFPSDESLSCCSILFRVFLNSRVGVQTWWWSGLNMHSCKPHKLLMIPTK